MRKHSITLLLACIFVTQQSIAQITITKENHSFTAGDRLQFLHVAFPKDYYLEEEHLWDFFRMQSLEKVTSQRYFKTGDSCLHRMACIEGDTRYYYDIHGDTLLMSGYESPLVKMIYDEGEPLLHFPMHEGDVLEGYYHGRGMYCDRIALRNYGHCHTEAITSGRMLIPEGDTLQNVLLLHTERIQGVQYVPDIHSDSLSVFTTDSVHRHLMTDSTLVKLVNERWYAQGYRYPILETRQIQTLQGEPLTETQALYCSPYAQSELDDEVNEGIRQQLIDTGHHDRNQKSTGTNRNSSDGQHVSPIQNTNVSINGTTINISFDLTADATVNALVCDISGMVYRSESLSGQAANSYQFSINCSGLHHGQYVLYLNVNGQVTGQTINL